MLYFQNNPKPTNSLMDTRPLKYPLCPIESHAQEPLSRICLDKGCAEKVPVCCICEFQKHKGHNTIPIVNIIKQLKSSSENISPIEGASHLSALRKQFFDSIANCKRELLHELSELESKGEIYFNSCEETLFGFYELGKPIPDQAQSDPKYYKRFFNRLLALIPTDNKSQFQVSSKIDSLINTFKDHQKRFSQNIATLEQNFKKSIKTVQSNFGKQKMYDARWSQILKGAKVKINEMVAEQSGMESSGQRFCLMDEPLPDNKTIQWGVKVKKFVGWVGVGVCLKNLIKTANYHFNYSNIGHGSYLISTNGYTWSHSIKEFNSSSKCFSFTNNDIVYIQYDPINLKLRFRKNQGKDPKEKYELTITAPPAGDAYHPCVNLCSTGDSVEIITPGVPLS